MEDRKKLVIHLRSAWMTDRIRDFPVVQKQYFTTFYIPVNMEQTVAIHRGDGTGR